MPEEDGPLSSLLFLSTTCFGRNDSTRWCDNIEFRVLEGGSLFVVVVVVVVLICVELIRARVAKVEMSRTASPKGEIHRTMRNVWLLFSASIFRTERNWILFFFWFVVDRKNANGCRTILELIWNLVKVKSIYLVKNNYWPDLIYKTLKLYEIKCNWPHCKKICFKVEYEI